MTHTLASADSRSGGVLRNTGVWWPGGQVFLGPKPRTTSRQPSGLWAFGFDRRRPQTKAGRRGPPPPPLTSPAGPRAIAGVETRNPPPAGCYPQAAGRSPYLPGPPPPALGEVGGPARSPPQRGGRWAGALGPGGQKAFIIVVIIRDAAETNVKQVSPPGVNLI